jgi:uncharacterized protein YndB with AHSA1/START domain
MNRTSVAPELGFHIELERRIRAPIADVFDVLLEQAGPGFESPDGNSLSLRLEATPGGRWYRDLGDGNGHWWGTVQSIRRPELLELRGPLFMSQPVCNTVQYRLEEGDGVTTLRMSHTAFGPVPESARDNMPHGWGHLMDRIQAHFA